MTARLENYVSGICRGKEIHMLKESVDEITSYMMNKTTEELLSIWIENDQQKWSDAAFVAIKQVLTERGVTLPQQKVPMVNSVMFGGNKELNHYVMDTTGIGRKGLNIMCFIGIFIFGWLLAIVFDELGKKGKGWFYIVPIIGILVISRQSETILGILAPIIYIIGWIHANLILSRYQSLARKRIMEIDSFPEPRIDEILEKGILFNKVLRDAFSADNALEKAVSMPGGSSTLLNMAGVTLMSRKKDTEAIAFFNRALSVSQEAKERELIEKNRKLAQVRIEKKKKAN
jgi:hypothetical protein